MPSMAYRDKREDLYSKMNGYKYLRQGEQGLLRSGDVKGLVRSPSVCKLFSGTRKKRAKTLVERMAEQIKEYFICWKRVFPGSNTSTAAAARILQLFLRHLSSTLLGKTIFASGTSASQLSDPGSFPIASHIFTNYHLLRKEVSWNSFWNKFNYIFSTLFCFLLSIFYFLLMDLLIFVNSAFTTGIKLKRCFLFELLMHF